MCAMDGGPFERLARARRKREMLRRLRELDRIDATHGLGAHASIRPRRQRRTRGGGSLVAGLVAVAIVVLVMGFGTSGVPVAVRTALGLGPEPLASVPLLPSGKGSFAFMQTQPGRPKTPVAYDPCRKIEVVVNPDGAPDDYMDLVETATDRISDATGLKFDITGTTDERPSDNRQPEDNPRYGPGWAPVLVAWSDNDETPELDGDVAGLGGSTAITVRGVKIYVTGGVTLDSEAFREITHRMNGRVQAQAIVDHEFGHLVGLDHVKDAGELMNAENKGRTTWGPGDKAGLSRLGRGPCL
jgi:hypothetical protein